MKRTSRGRALSLSRVAARFERWREQRSSRRERIPEELWSAAVAAAKQHGVCGTARALSLDYTALKKRMNGAELPSSSCPSTTATNGHFVEVLPPKALFDASRCTLEVTTPHGVALSLTLPVAAGVEVARQCAVAVVGRVSV